MTQTPDPHCPFCSGTGLTLLMEDCPCGERSYTGDEYAEAFGIEDEDEDEPAPAPVIAASALTRRSYKPASPAQMTLLTALVAERDPAVPTVAEAKRLIETPGATIYTDVASKFIGALMKIPATKPRIRPNSYPGACEKCRGEVEAGAGRIEKIDGRWKTFHLDGECLTVEEAAVVAADAVSEPGIYEKAGAYYRVRAGRYDKSTFWAEKIWMTPHSVSFSRAGRASFLRASDRLDWKEARRLGVAFNACINCGKSLSDERSVIAGYGETCAKNNHWPYPKTKEASLVMAGGATWPDDFGY